MHLASAVQVETAQEAILARSQHGSCAAAAIPRCRRRQRCYRRRLLCYDVAALKAPEGAQPWRRPLRVICPAGRLPSGTVPVAVSIGCLCRGCWRRRLCGGGSCQWRCALPAVAALSGSVNCCEVGAAFRTECSGGTRRLDESSAAGGCEERLERRQPARCFARYPSRAAAWTANMRQNAVSSAIGAAIRREHGRTRC